MDTYTNERNTIGIKAYVQQKKNLMLERTLTKHRRQRAFLLLHIFFCFSYAYHLYNSQEPFLHIKKTNASSRSSPLRCPYLFLQDFSSQDAPLLVSPLTTSTLLLRRNFLSFYNRNHRCFSMCVLVVCTIQKDIRLYVVHTKTRCTEVENFQGWSAFLSLLPL